MPFVGAVILIVSIPLLCFLSLLAVLNLCFERATFVSTCGVAAQSRFDVSFSL